MKAVRLVADIGGTNARFALVDEAGNIGSVCSLLVACFATFTDALDAYLGGFASRPEIAQAAFGAAGPVSRGQVKLTNAPWRLCEQELSQRLNGAQTKIFNDLEAVAHALPYLTPSDVFPLGEGAGWPLSEPQRMIAINVGTGFGAATVLPRGESWVACPSEAGHMALGAADGEELDLLRRCAAGRAVTVEDLLSGPQIAPLYELCGGRDAGLTGEDIMRRSANEPAAAKTVNWITRWLGRVTGDLVLATAAWGGAFLLGGVVSGWRAHADARLFRQAFSDKGKMSVRMAGVYTGAITRDDTPLLGLARAPITG